MQTVSKRQFIIYGVFLVALLAACSALFWYSTSMTIKNEDTRSMPEALDILFDFYNEWLDDAKANGKVQPDALYLSSTALDTPVRESLVAKLQSGNDGIDPALCQTSVPDEIKMRFVHQLPSAVEVMVISKYATGTPTGYALAKMSVVDRTWVITSIECIRGEAADTREFTFSTKGQLLKNVPAPFDNTKWHLVFSENGTPGHVVPLRFSTSSTCRTNNTDSICDVAVLKEAAYAKVDGTMTEAGVEVAKMEWSEAAF